MHELAERLLKAIRKQELIKAGDRVAVAVSGGADSVALLLLLLEMRAELGIVLSVAHVNHQLRGEESDEDEQSSLPNWRAATASNCTAGRATRTGANPELKRPPANCVTTSSGELASEDRVSKIATAHTLDDQAETVLLRMLRGTGIRGLSGIHPRLDLAKIVGEVVRSSVPCSVFAAPNWKPSCRERNETWREDSSNRDLAFLRNRVRHRVLPLLQGELWSGAVENLADLAEIARAEEEHWQSGIRRFVLPRRLRIAIGSLLSLPVGRASAG